MRRFLRNLVAAIIVIALILPAQRSQAASPALGELAQEIATLGADIDGAAPRLEAPNRATLDRDLALLANWRRRLDTLTPKRRSDAPLDTDDVLLLRAHLTRLVRVVNGYRSAAQRGNAPPQVAARDDRARLGHAAYEGVLRDELLLPYTASDVERLARAQLVENSAEVDWLETLAPLAHTVISQNPRSAHASEVAAFVRSRNLLSLPSTFAAGSDGDPVTMLAGVQQAAVAQQPDAVRKLESCAVFDQGWFAYAADMLVELGFFGDDPTNRMRVALGRRDAAAFALLDVKLNTGDWSYRQAVQFAVRETGANDQGAEASVAAIAQQPGRAIASLVGRLQLENLLADYRRRAGLRASLRDFHDRLLSYGSVPFVVLGPELLSDLAKS